MIGRALALALVLATLACSTTRENLRSALPDKPADYAEVREATNPHGDPVKREDRFAGPHFSVWMTLTASAGRLKLDRDYNAAPGHEFLLAYFQDTSTDFRPRWQGDKRPVISAAVVAGSRRVPVPIPTGKQVLVASVPKQAPAFLEITDDGRAQSINLRDGTLGPDAVALYNPLKSATLAVNHQFTGTIRAGGSQGQCDIGLVTHAAVLDPYYPGLGWAPAGRAWLQVSMDAYLTAYPTKGAYFSAAELRLDPVASFTLTTADGQRVPGAIQKRVTLVGPASSSPESFTVLFDVADPFRRGALTVAPAGSLKTTGYDGDVPASWITPPEPWRAEIDLA